MAGTRNAKAKTTLKYAKKPNPLPGGKGECFGRVIPNGTADQNALIDEMIASGCRIGREEIRRIMNATALFILDDLQQNLRIIDLGYCRLVPVIKGKFDYKDEKFDPKKHKLEIRVIPSPEIRDALKEGARMVDVTPVDVPPPHIDSVCRAPDFVRNAISVSGPFEIHGTSLTVGLGGESAALEFPSGATLAVALKAQTKSDGTRRVKAQVSATPPEPLPKRARLVFRTHGKDGASSPLHVVRSAWIRLSP